MNKKQDNLTQSIFQDLALPLFNNNEIKTLQDNIIIKNGKSLTECVIRDKEVQIKPEEIIR